METVGIAFGSALLGTIGGYLGSRYLEHEKTLRLRRGYLRALVAELRQNLLTVAIAREIKRPAGSELSSTTWCETRYELGAFLSIDAFTRIAAVYSAYPGIRRVLEGLTAGDEYTNLTENALATWLQAVRSAVDMLSNLPEVKNFELVPADDPSAAPGETLQASRGK